MLGDMEWWKLSLNFITGIAWPLVVALAVILLRRPLSKLLEGDVEVDVLGAKVKSVSRAEQTAGEALGDAVQAVSIAPREDQGKNENLVPEERPDTSDERDLLRARVAMLESKLLEKRQDEEVRRAALERVLAEGVRLGWEWAQLGEDQPPALKIDWTSEGSPRVSTLREPKHTSHFRPTSAAFNAATYVKRISRVLQSTLKGAHIEEGALLSDIGREADISITLDNGKRVIIEARFNQNKIDNQTVAQLASFAISRDVAGAILISTTPLTSAASRALHILEQETGVLTAHAQWRGPEDNENLQLVVFQMLRSIDPCK